ncbi:MAG: methanogenesis marker 12 protein [Euryarchaeota archaeon]|nr:methanogenesis marker 12 protein [Euryarchaeota archaeon]
MGLYLGIDHGTRAVRFTLLREKHLESVWGLPRLRAARLSARQVLQGLEGAIGIPLEDIRMAAMAYGMGDGFSRIVPLSRLRNRGIRGPAGPLTGGGARVFDALRASRVPAVAVPGLHPGTLHDPRFHLYSHGAGADKAGVSRAAREMAGADFIVVDVGANCAGVAVSRGVFAGALDATLLSPGLLQGPLDLDGLRRADSRGDSALREFSTGGVLHRYRLGSEEALFGPSRRAQSARRALALHVAMVMASLRVPFPRARLLLSGSAGLRLRPHVARLLGEPVASAGPHAAARGCALIARDVSRGAREVLGIPVVH